MLNSKYSKVLTIILIVAIVAIVGLLIFVGFDWYRAYTTNSDADEFLGQFNEIVKNTQTGENNQVNDISNEVIDPIIDINNTVTQPNGTTGGNTTSGKDIKYKGYTVVGRIEIPKTKVDYPVLAEATPNALKTSICVLHGPGINKVGNTVIIGHNFRNGTFFSNNNKLEKGDKVYLTDMEGKRIAYTITNKYMTDSNDFDYATRDTKGKREISLSTCNNDSSKRIIIWAVEE